MKKCDQCGTLILFGGIRQGPWQFCGEDCRGHAATQSLTFEVPEYAVMDCVAAVFQSHCPRCGRFGPLDVQRYHYVWSFFFLSSMQTEDFLACERCGNWKRFRSACFSGLFGWWSFPWGVVFTPIQVVRNVAGICLRKAPHMPSPALVAWVRRQVSLRAAEVEIQEEQLEETAPPETIKPGNDDSPTNPDRLTANSANVDNPFQSFGLQ